MGDLQDNVSLLAAGLDLALVQSIITAIRTADLSRPPVSPDVPASTTIAAQPAATSLPGQPKGLRYSDQPAATFHPQPPADPHLPKVRDLLPYACSRPVEPPLPQSTIQAPWKVLPWPVKVPRNLAHHYERVKILPNRDDVTTAGRLLDIFV